MISSVVVGILPSLEHDPYAKVDTGYGYAVTDYNQDQKAVKFSNPSCNPKFCVSNEKVTSFT